MLYCNPAGRGTSALRVARKAAAEYTAMHSRRGSSKLATGYTVLMARFPAYESAETGLHTRHNSFVRDWHLGKLGLGTDEFEERSNACNGRLDLRPLYSRILSRVPSGILRVRRVAHGSVHTGELPGRS